MKFIIYLSLLILILAPFISVDCRKNSKKSKKIKNKQLGLMNKFPITYIQRPYSNLVSVSRPVSAYVSSSPSFFSGTPQGPRFGIGRGGYVSRPYRLVRPYAVLRLTLNECPEEFRNNVLARERDDYCPEVCTRRFCVQIKEICCIYKEELDDSI